MKPLSKPVAAAAFPPEAGSVAAARRFVRRTLREWGLEAAADDAVLATSELATNAVTYAGTPFEVCCRLDGDEVYIEVRDQHPLRHLTMPGLDRTSGRGLLSTARLSSSWGVSYDSAAKRVWFKLRAPHGAEPKAEMQEDVLVGAAAGYDAASLGPVSPPSGRRRPVPAPLQEAIDRAGESARELLRADVACVLLAGRDGRLSVATSVADQNALADLREVTVNVEDVGTVARVHSDPRVLPFAAAVGARSLVTAPLMVQGRVAGMVLAAAEAPGRFDETDGERLARVADRLSLSMERARVVELERSWRGWLSFVAEASDLLAGTLDQERTMALVAQLVVPRLATWCAVYGVDEGGVARLAYTWHADETLTDALGELLEAVEPARTVLEAGPWTGLAAVPPSVRDRVKAMARDLAYAFPLVARGRRIGMMVIGRPEGDRFPRSVIDLAEELGRRAALAIDNARLYSAQTAMSTAFQRSLLPPDVPEVHGLDVAVVYEPAGERSEVGGDFYDIFLSGTDSAGRRRWRFAIGDVCGTGPEAAAVTGLARHTLRILAGEGLAVPDVMGRLNRLILEEGPRARLLTLLHGELVVYGQGRARMRLVCAGHPPPLRLHGDGTVEEVSTPQPLLGVFDDVSFDEETVELDVDQVLLCVTDGVTERRNGARMLGDDQGLERLLSGCTGLSAGAVAARIQRAVRDFSPEPSNDDVALIVLRAIGAR